MLHATVVGARGDRPLGRVHGWPLARARHDEGGAQPPFLALSLMFLKNFRGGAPVPREGARRWQIPGHAQRAPTVVGRHPFGCLHIL